jgi:uncharacterized membrane protein (UPF0127 family)
MMKLWMNRAAMCGLAALALLGGGVAAGAAGAKVAGAKMAANAAPAVQRTHPVSNLPVIPLLANGHRLAVELAATEAQQEVGLMFRKAMGADEGMLFPMNPPRQAYFWMRNTVMPLDIVFIGADRKVLNVVQAKPLDETPLPSAGKAGAVLELNVGRAEALGIRPGTVVSW